jgi:hypothetical protein
MSHSNPDLAQEQRIAERLTNIVKSDAVSEFILEHRDGLFDENTLDAWLTKRREDRPHRFIGDNTIAPEVVTAARAGNITARGKVFVALGRDQAALDALLAAPAADTKKLDADPAFKGKVNPWRAEYWSKTEQGRIAKTLGVAVAERMARAANSTLGATKPSRIAS